MATSYTRNLRLKVDSNLTANAKYNLERIDTLGSTFIVDSTDTLKLRSKTNILIEPQSADLGGSVSAGGTVNIGTDGQNISVFSLNASTIKASTPYGTKDQASGGSNYLFLKYDSTLDGSGVDSSDRTISLDPKGANRSFSLGGNLSFAGGNLDLTLTADTAVTLPTSGTLATLANTETLTNKTIDDDYNTILNLALSGIKTLPADANKALVRDALGAVVSSKISNVNIADDAAILDSKLATIASAGKVSNSATTATPNNTAGAIVLRDPFGNFSAGIITAALNGNAATASFASIAASFSGPLSGDVTGTQTGTVVSFVNGIPAATVAAGINLANAATSNNTGLTLVKRDGSGNFSAGTITANLIGTATNVTGIVGVSNGGTGANTATAGLKNLLPDQTSNAGKVLVTDSNTQSWGLVTDAALADDSITRGKLRSGFANHVLINDASGVMVSEAQLSLTRGGTGAGSAIGARTNILPDQAGQTDKYLRTDGTDVYWSAAAGGGGANFSTTWETADGLIKTVLHNLGTQKVQVSIIDLDDNTMIGIDSIVVTDDNVLTLTASETPASSWRIVVQGF